MAIQMRRGLKKDFDPKKMMPGEWAVSIDDETANQIVWMCFAPGIVKRMGTYEDFQDQIRGATNDIREEYIQEFTKLIDEIGADVVIQIRDQITTEYLPEILEYVKKSEANKDNAVQSAKNAATSETNAKNWATLAESYARGGTGSRAGEETDNAMYYYNQARHIANAPYFENEDDGKVYIYSLYAKGGIPHMALIEKE